MPPHTFPPKRLGACICCGQECYAILARHPETGEATRVGPMLDHAVQLEFLLSNGREVDLTGCRGCAATLTPADYLALWRVTVDRTAVSLAGRPANERRVKLARLLSTFPVALLRHRREDQATRRLVVDRGAPAHA